MISLQQDYDSQILKLSMENERLKGCGERDKVRVGELERENESLRLIIDTLKKNKNGSGGSSKSGIPVKAKKGSSSDRSSTSSIRNSSKDDRSTTTTTTRRNNHHSTPHPHQLHHSNQIDLISLPNHQRIIIEEVVVVVVVGVEVLHLPHNVHLNHNNYPCHIRHQPKVTNE